MAHIHIHYLIWGFLGIYQWKLSVITSMCRAVSGLSKTQNVIFERVSQTNASERFAAHLQPANTVLWTETRGAHGVKDQFCL